MKVQENHCGVCDRMISYCVCLGGPQKDHSLVLKFQELEVVQHFTKNGSYFTIDSIARKTWPRVIGKQLTTYDEMEKEFNRLKEC